MVMQRCFVSASHIPFLGSLHGPERRPCLSATQHRPRRPCGPASARLGRSRLQARPNSAEVELVNPPPPQGQLESTKLDRRVVEKVEDAVESLGGRVTVGEVAARAGVRLNEAEAALNALAADSLGTLQVSEEGDVLYVLPANFRATIRQRSWLLRARPLLDSARETGAYLVRVAFGSALVASLAIVWLTIIAILSSSQSDDRNNGRGNSYGGGSYGGGGYYRRSPGFVFFDSYDLLWFTSRRPPRYYHEPKQGMSFLESIFSFVFGDGDPNLKFEEERWQTVGEFISEQGGVVTAEQLAPYLDPPPAPASSSEQVDEAFMVPALVRFGGSPEVDDNGNLLYRFPSLQRSGATRRGGKEEQREPAALQTLWQLTKAEGGQKLGAVALGAANLVGVVVLAGLLGSANVQQSLANSSLAFVNGLFPFLQAYAASFFVIPAVRWVLNEQRNAGIKRANQARLDSLRALREPDAPLQAKLRNAARQAKRVVVRDDEIVYRSDRASDEQSRDLEAEDFDRKLAARPDERGRNRGPDWLDWAPSETVRKRS